MERGNHLGGFCLPGANRRIVRHSASSFCASPSANPAGTRRRRGQARVKSLFRITMVFMAVVLLVPVSGAAAKKRGYSLGDRTLKEGSTGSDVKTLQRLLTKAGLKTLADGAFGPGTTENVKAFETSQRR